MIIQQISDSSVCDSSLSEVLADTEFFPSVCKIGLGPPAV